MTIKSLLSRKRKNHYIYCLLPVVLLLFTSCKEESKETTKLAGKIINARKDYVTLLDFNGLQDTIFLDENGAFSKSYSNLSSGLYTFTHPNEYQSLFIAKGDSIVLRLNTKAFDETLAFSGSHAKENNYLINLYVQIEEENKDFLNNYKKPYQAFASLVDSIKNIRLEDLHKVAKIHEFDKDFICHAEEVISFSAWSKMERYPFVHYGKNDFLKSKELPESFYAYRNQFKIDEPALLNNIAYRPYVSALVSYLTFNKLAKELGAGILVDRSSLRYYQERLKVIDSLFTPGVNQDTFASNDTQRFIMNRKNANEINELVDVFLEMTENAELEEQITTMASTYIKLDPGNEMPDIKLQNTDREKIDLSDRVDKLSVLFFWSDKEREYAIRVHDKIKELRIKYPEIDFIGINLDDFGAQQWEEAYERYDFDPAMEYQILNTSPVISQLALRNNDRSMVVDKNMTIIDPSINLFHYQIETTLLGYINR